MNQTLEPSKNGSKALALARDTNTLRGLLERSKGSIAATLPRHLTPDRIIKVALVAVSRSPLLQKCTAESVLKCVMVAAQLGLDPSGVLGSAYMVPYWNKELGAYEAQLIPGYRGMIDLARRSGQIASIEARCVYQGEHFEYEQGLNPKLVHRPSVEADQSEESLRLVYAIARFKDPDEQPQVEVMTRAKIDAIRRRSKSGDKGPWVTDYEEMARKTVVKRMAKYLPLTVEFQNAVELDNAGAAGDAMPNLVDGMLLSPPEVAGLPAAKPTRRLAAQLQEQHSPQPPRRAALDGSDSPPPPEPEPAYHDSEQVEDGGEGVDSGPDPIDAALDQDWDDVRRVLLDAARKADDSLSRETVESGLAKHVKLVLKKAKKENTVTAEERRTLYDALVSGRFNFDLGVVTK